MTKYTNDNTSYAAYRVFETLKFLINQPATVEDIINHLESLEMCGDKNYSKAVVYKYLTTLKFAGITLSRHKCKYEVQNLPFKINLTEDNLKALSILNEIINATPEKNLSETIKQFFYQLKMRYALQNKQDTETCEIKNIIEKPSQEQKKEIKEYEKYCEDGLRLKVSYIDIYGNEVTSTYEPIEAYYTKNQVKLLCYCTNPSGFIEFTSTQIKAIEQTPLKCSNRFFSSTTAFKLKGKLAKRYTLRNEEHILSENNGEITVINQNEPKNLLFARLMRYGENCEVISSKQDRRNMKSLIKNTLSNY